jgi:hypothetical protein
LMSAISSLLLMSVSSLFLDRAIDFVSFCTRIFHSSPLAPSHHSSPWPPSSASVYHSHDPSLCIIRTTTRPHARMRNAKPLPAPSLRSSRCTSIPAHCRHCTIALLKSIKCTALAFQFAHLTGLLTPLKFWFILLSNQIGFPDPSVPPYFISGEGRGPRQ